MGPREKYLYERGDVGTVRELRQEVKIAKLADALEEVLARWRNASTGEFGSMDGTWDKAVESRVQALLRESGVGSTYTVEVPSS